MTRGIRHQLTRLHDAENDRERLDAAIEKIEADARHERERVSAAYQRGDVTVDQAEERIEAIDAQAEKERRRATIVLDAITGLREEGATLVRERADELDAALASEDADAAAEVERIRLALDEAEGRRERIAGRRLELATEARLLLASFDKAIADAMREQGVQDTKLVRWAISQGCTPSVLRQLPERLHERATREYDQLRVRQQLRAAGYNL
jgi:hypothetical protein